MEKCLASGAKEASRPAARMQDSLEILDLLTEWEKGVFESLKDVGANMNL